MVASTVRSRQEKVVDNLKGQMVGEIIVSPSFIGLRDDCAERRENVGGEIMFCSNR